MFNKRSNSTGSVSSSYSPSTSSSSSSVERSHSVLSQSVKISGEISAKDDLRIDGTVEGNINCDGKVIIGPEGCVTGNIKSNSVELMGKVVGDVVVYDIVRLKSTSYFKGEITAVNLEIEAGASFYGNCKMSEKEEEKSYYSSTNTTSVATSLDEILEDE